MQYNQKINVMRQATKSDGLGGVMPDGDPAVIHTNLPCRINWSGAREKAMFGKTDYLRDAKLYCRVVDIVETDVVVHNGVEYNIVGLRNVDSRNRQMVLDIVKLST